MHSEQSYLPHSSSLAHVQRSKPNEVFFIRIEASPKIGSDDFGIVGGGMVNCYLDTDDLYTAEMRAIALIQQYDWQPLRFDGWELTSDACNHVNSTDKDQSASTKLIQEALTEGEACEFFCWPIDATDVGDSGA